MKKVKVYSTPACPFCIKAKQFLKDNNVEFENLDVTVDQALTDEMVKISGQMGVPVLDVNGKVIVGFNKSEIENALKR